MERKSRINLAAERVAQTRLKGSGTATSIHAEAAAFWLYGEEEPHQSRPPPTAPHLYTSPRAASPPPPNQKSPAPPQNLLPHHQTLEKNTTPPNPIYKPIFFRPIKIKKHKIRPPILKKPVIPLDLYPHPAHEYRYAVRQGHPWMSKSIRNLP